MAAPLSAGQAAPGGQWLLVILFAVMAALVFLTLWLLSAARAQSERELQRLFQQNVELYLERLDHNRLLRLVFRKPVLTLYKLEGYMKQGDGEAVQRALDELDRARLQPRDKVQFLQKRLSYYVEVGDDDQARASRDALADYLHRSKADRNEKYRKMIEDADQIIGVYVNRDTALIVPLKNQAAATADPVQRGILQYRIAKLCHFDADEETTRVYLKRALKNLQNTYYQVMIEEALRDPTALERQ